MKLLIYTLPFITFAQNVVHLDDNYYVAQGQSVTIDALYGHGFTMWIRADATLKIRYAENVTIKRRVLTTDSVYREPLLVILNNFKPINVHLDPCLNVKMPKPIGKRKLKIGNDKR